MISRAFLAVVGGIAAVVVLGLVTLVAVQQRDSYAEGRVGGAFALLDMFGKPVTDADLRGKPSAIFFGYTSCPDVCPTTLSSLTTALGRLGAAADRLTVAFVTVDPERDTPAQMRDYLSSFDPRIRGLTGTEAQTEAIAKAYHVVHRRVWTGGGSYAVDHSSTVYLMDEAGRLAGEINYGEDQDRVEAKLAALVHTVDDPSAPAARVDLWSDAVRLARQLCGL
ncbi:SCO family protein [Lichenihabitans sp. Uapishka_5]|uniref:SCO family protein n=1 Tax=Lichenihabitans sp. Uapishka_5 TaxID=3037302 RepID=UPI0029E829EF|nr:SCO family protein [Lichenihabitans sp. Uapishka_5]MDX7951549.1 SCO family protein [Lichenihabitans sp. Uapishka_5]